MTLAKRILAATVTGLNHKLLCTPNQDSYLFRHFSGVRGWAAAVADGHGSSAHPLSQHGSRLAVEIALECCEYIISMCSKDYESLASPSDWLWQELSKMICRKWSESVLLHFQVHSDEVFGLHQKCLNDEDVSILYGSTLALAFTFSDQLYTLSIGDSDISIVLNMNHQPQAHVNIHEANDYSGEQTESLCMKNAWKESTFMVYDLDQVASVFLHTDGVGKSLESESDLQQLLLYYHARAESDSPDYEVQADMYDQLLELTTNGSGDDCTLVQILV